MTRATGGGSTAPDLSAGSPAVAAGGRAPRARWLRVLGVVPAQLVGVLVWLVFVYTTGPLSAALGADLGQGVTTLSRLMMGPAIAGAVVLALPTPWAERGARAWLAAAAPVLVLACLARVHAASWHVSGPVVEDVGVIALTGLAGTLAAGLARSADSR